MWVTVLRTRRTPPKLVIAAGLALAIFMQTGCGPKTRSGPSGVVPVTGKVTLDDQPLAGALVTYVPINSPTGETFDAGGVTNEQGVYELRSGDGETPGALPGEYRVVISRLVMADGSLAKADKEKSPMQLALEGAKETVPTTYSDMAFSKLKATIPAAGGNFDFPLKSK
jgi:hypothetical protein